MWDSENRQFLDNSVRTVVAKTEQKDSRPNESVMNDAVKRYVLM